MPGFIGNKFQESMNEVMTNLAEDMLKSRKAPDPEDTYRILAWLILNQIGLQKKITWLSGWGLKIFLTLITLSILILFFAEKSDVISLASKLFGH